MSKEIQKPEGFGAHFEIRDLHSGESVSDTTFGGKGANLSFLAANGLPVPEGYCVGKQVHKLYKDNFTLPLGLVTEIELIKNRLGGAVAIRSSAVGEDGNDLSMAGVFSTVYVKNNDSIEAAILEVFTQAGSDEVKKSLQQHGIESTEIEMGLVVQQLLSPEVSGVVFTGVGERNYTLIQYVDGLGNSLVDGKIPGSTIVLDSEGKLLQHVQAPGQRQLSDAAILGLCGLSSEVSNLLGESRLDIEWGLEDEQLYVLQARPLTTEVSINFGNGSICLLNASSAKEGVVLCVGDFETPETVIQNVKNLKADGQNVILVSKTIDLSLDPALADSDGLLAESVSVVSHGAIRSRELGIGAIGGVDISNFKTGDIVFFDPYSLSVKNKEGDELLKPLYESRNNDEIINDHLGRIACFVYTKDPGMEGALDWMEKTLDSHLDAEDAKLLFRLVIENKPDSQVEYVEEGYDSCQSNRKVAKVVSEILMIGGMIYEANLLGESLSIGQAKKIIGSGLNFQDSLAVNLAKIAQRYGANQSFIFPGITPSTSDTLPIREYAEKALQGEPMVSVRSLTGIGGLRFDQEWNHTTDFKTFLKWKLEEDKRYYPGIGMLYALLESDLDKFPVMRRLGVDQPELYSQVLKLIDSIKHIDEVDLEGVAVLCSAYLPERSQIESFLKTADVERLDLLQAFHSPAYELSAFKNLIEDFANGAFNGGLHSDSVERLLAATQNIWSFNSTIHISWADKLSTMANGLVGQLKNSAGDYSIRYGIGRNGKSIEIREHNFSVMGPSGPLVGYEVRVYSNSEVFSGNFEIFALTPEDELWGLIQKQGFLKAAINCLDSKA